MWMRFPEGVDRVVVQLQEFAVETSDEAGRGYFRVPDHFAPNLLQLGMGFAIAEPPEGTDLTDLPQADPLRDTTIVQLTQQNESLKKELASVRADANSTLAKLHAMENEKNVALDAVGKLSQENETLRGRLEVFESEKETLEALAAEKAKKK